MNIYSNITDKIGLLKEQRRYWIENPLKRTKDLMNSILETRKELDTILIEYKRIQQLKSLSGSA